MGMEVNMISSIKWLMPLVAVGLPLAASAQTSDAAYCKALAAKYEAFIETRSGHTQAPGGVDGSVAVEQCKAGNTAQAIPVLERKLQDAKIALPNRG
jgi:hypothetical protein